MLKTIHWYDQPLLLVAKWRKLLRRLCNAQLNIFYLTTEIVLYITQQKEQHCSHKLCVLLTSLCQISGGQYDSVIVYRILRTAALILRIKKAWAMATETKAVKQQCDPRWCTEQLGTFHKYFNIHHAMRCQRPQTQVCSKRLWELNPNTTTPALLDEAMLLWTGDGSTRCSGKNLEACRSISCNPAQLVI